MMEALRQKIVMDMAKTQKKGRGFGKIWNFRFVTGMSVDLYFAE